METLSVIVPVYNCKEYLKDCIESVAAIIADCGDGFSEEIILVDDGSSDGSSELCDRIAGNLGSEKCKVKAIHQENKGVSVARNRGLQEATGDYVLFVDSDDTVESRKLAAVLRDIPKDEPIDMIVFGLSFDYYAGKRIYRRDEMLPPVEGEKTYDECVAMLDDLYETNMMSPLWNKVIRRSLIERADIRLREDMFLYEDLEFSLRLMARCRKFLFCAEPIYHYRQVADEGNAGRRLKRIEHITEIVDKIEDALVLLNGSDDILLSLYLVLAREKLECVSKADMNTVCRDFRDWVNGHGLLDKIRNNGYAMLLYNSQIAKLLYKRRISKIRHRIAVAVKKTVGDFRKR